MSNSTDNVGPVARTALAVLALGNVVDGAWAAFAPRSFFDDFPGRGHWVARAAGSATYDAHLVSDVGAFFLAFGVAFAIAAWRAHRELVLPLCVAWTVFAVLHLIWHVTHLDGFPTADAVSQTVGLVVLLVLGAIPLGPSLARSGRRRPTSR